MDEPTPLLRCAVSDTGPLISALQTRQMNLLQTLYDRIYIVASALPEYIQPLIKDELNAFIATGLVVVCELDASEITAAQQIAQEIAAHPAIKDRNAASHYPEAEAIVLAQRTTLNAQELLVDEIVARDVARKHGVALTGFAGILIRCCRQNQVTPDQVQRTLRQCQAMGTHYATEFIDGIYRRLKEDKHDQT